MVALSDLPYEILHDIVSHLPGVDRARIAGLSHLLHDISQPLLYSAPFLLSSAKNLDSSRELFLRTLLTPSGTTLAAHVRTLRVEWDVTERECTTACLSDSHTVCSAIATRLHLSQPLRTQGAQLMIIFYLLPQLRILHLIPANGTPTESLYPFAQFIERSGPLDTLSLALPALRSFHCPRFTCPGISGISGWTMLMLLNLPNIRTIDVPNFTRHKISFFLLHAHAAPSTLTNLRLSSAYMPSSWALSYILRATTALTHFSYSRPAGDFDPVGLMKALLPLRPTLRSLHLDVADASVANEDRSRPYTVGSLREWPALRTVRSGLTPLLGAGPRVEPSRLVDVLPVGICEMEILPDRYWAVEERVRLMEELMRFDRGLVPVLRRVAVVDVVEEEAWWEGGASGA